MSLPSAELVGSVNCTGASFVAVEVRLPANGESESGSSNVVVSGGCGFCRVVTANPSPFTLSAPTQITGVSGRSRGRRRGNPSLPAGS